MRKLTKKLGALLLAAVIAGAVPAAAVDTERTDCSLEISLAADPEMNNGELKNEAFPVALYRVADVDGAYNYTPAEAFKALEAVAYTPEEGEAVTLNIAGYKDMKAGEQTAVALAAAELAGTLEADYAGKTENGAVTFRDLGTGLYLVLAETAVSGEHEYSFAPVLVSLPSMEGGELDADGNIIDGTWSGADVYEVTFSLKPETAPVYGGMTLTKTLTSFSGGPATFVFQIEAVMPNPSDANNPTVTAYSDVVSLVFDGPGVKTYTIAAGDEKLPLGAEVTVTEVYSGAGYSPAAGTETSQGFKLGWQEDGSWSDGGEASFVNEYNESLVTGSAVDNYFEFVESGENVSQEAVNGSWIWEARYDYAQVG